MTESDPRASGRFRSGLRRGFSATFVASLLIVIAALPSGAAGDAGLSQHIISNPVPGWSAVPPSQLNSLVSDLNRAENAGISRYGGHATSAALGWRPANGGTGLIVSLIAFVFKGFSGSQVAQQGHLAAKTGAVSFCKGATGTGPRTNGSVSSIPGSHIVTCATVKGVVPEAVTFTRANVLAIIESTRADTSSRKLVAVARKQYQALPTTTSPVSGG